MYSRKYLIFNLAIVLILAFLVAIGETRLILFALPLVGAIQFYSAFKAAVSGSLIMSYYTIISIAFLVVYFVGLKDIVAVLSEQYDIVFDKYFLAIPPLAMAIVYTVLIFIETWKSKLPPLL